MRLKRQVRVLVEFGLLFLLSGWILLLSGSGPYATDRGAEAQAHADSGLQLARSGDLPSAEAELRQAVTLEPRNPEFLSTLGTLLAIDHKLEESTAVFRKALQLAPQDLTVRRYLAANLWQLHRYSEAKQQLQILLQQQPNDAPSRLLRGMAAENTQDFRLTSVQRLP
jgi:Flp pilus assembly protein TadD